MKGIATSDLHLGFRRHPATIGGRNARECDVERAWEHVVQHVVEQQPDIFTIAGDCFDHARPSMHALRAFQTGIQAILRETSAYVVIIPGNHEGSKTVEALTPVVLAEVLDQRVIVVQEPRRIRLSIFRTGETVSIDCFPFGVLGAAAAHELVPDPDADVSMMLIHAAVRTSAVEGAIPAFYAGEDKVDVGAIAQQYNVIAAGDYHEFTRLHPTKLAFYSGSIERTAANMWPESAPKGVVSYDTATGELELLEIPTRRMWDLDESDFDFLPEVAIGGSVSVNAILRALLEQPGIAGGLVRVVVEDFPHEERDAVDQALVRQLRERCLHFQLDVRYREAALREVQAQRQMLAASLDEEAAAFLADDPAEVRELALRYMQEAA